MSQLRRSFALLLFLAAAPAVAQQSASAPASTAQSRAPIPASEWGRFETLGASAISPDGKWVAYDFRIGAGGGELRYRAGPSGAEQAVRNGAGAVFSKNSRWLVYTITPDTAGDGRGGRGGAAGGRGGRGGGAAGASTAAVSNRNKVGIVDLRSGATTVLEDIQSFVLSSDGAHVALRRYLPQGRTSRGSDLVIRDLEAGSDVTLGNVADYTWSDDGATLAMTIDVEGKTGNGVQVLNAATGNIRSLDATDQTYSNLEWRPRSADLVVFRSRADTAFLDTSYVVIAWKGVGGPGAAKKAYDFTADNAFPPLMRVAAYRRPVWSDDGGVLFFGIAERDMKPQPHDRGAPQPARVEVWHYKDLREYHQQDRQSAQDRTRTILVAWHLAPNKLVPLSRDPSENVQLSANRKVALVSDEDPYFKEVISGRQYRDEYLIDIASGKREKVITKSPSNGQLSPDGRYILYSQAGHQWAYDIAAKKATNLTAQIKSAFVDLEDDHPVADRRAYGSAGWTTGEKSLILYDRFDLWQVNADGTGPVRLTRGKEDSTVYRFARTGGGGGRGSGGGRGGRGGGAGDATDPEDRWIDPAKPLTLAATGEYSKKSGYARLTIGQPAQRLLWLDKAVSRLEKAKEADVYLLEEQTAAESPNLFVAGPTLADAKPVSHTNAFLSDYAMGRQVLMPYSNKRGDKLQMMLTYPANYDPAKKYPMVVYYYEKLSQGFHQFIVPSDRATYNTSVFSQNGYFVLRPDVVFQPRNAGFSGMDCVTSAVKATLAAVPAIDPKKVGNMGHSWGGYQSAFYAVHDKGTFAATIAGAPLTDFVSFYGYTSFNTGSAETGHYETGQERMQVSMWEDREAYYRNSTVLSVDSLKIPLLLEEGDADGNVNYWQSMELYNYGRRLGKQVVFLVYNDENHGVARPESQMDYHTRQLEWFDHFLKGTPAPDWITKGETYMTRQKLLKEAAASREPTGRGAATIVP